ncbi:MAG TPA: hypothetical protein VG675_20060 [Bryobacteraceae bacterium]|nr:hypothetical protein [Bryobacteraceae bacterium]
MQTLKLIASPEAMEILREAQRENTDRRILAVRAMEYIQSGPQPLAGQDLDALASRVARVVGVGKWTKQTPARFNQAGDKALVDLIYKTAEDRFTYTATFHKISGLWRLRGVRETLQEFVMDGLEAPKRHVPPLATPPELPTRRPLLPVAPDDVWRLPQVPVMPLLF